MEIIDEKNNEEKIENNDTNKDYYDTFVVTEENLQQILNTFR